MLDECCCIFVGNYKLLIQKNSVVNLTELETEIDYIKALEEHADKKTFIKETTRLLNQIEKLQKKKEVIHDILRQRFNTTEMTYAKFNNTLVEIENIFYLNIKSILNKLNVFDQEEYNQLQKEIGMKNVKREFIEAKLNIYGQYITFIKGAVEDNDQILIKLDELLLELSKLNSLEDGELEEMNAMKELDALISKTKLYR